MTTITQVVTTLPAAPDPATMTRDQFNTAAAAYVIAQKAMVPELNTWAGQVNTVAGEVSASAIATAADAVATGLDAVATAADRVQTGLDAAAASASAAAAASAAMGFVGTSTTSLAIGTGSKTFTTQASEQYTAGIWVTAVSAADPANYMYGQVTSYSSTTLIVNVTKVGGSGTLADWNISLAGVQGEPGAGITEQATGFTATGGTTPKTLTVDDDLTTSQAARRNAANTFTGLQTFGPTKDTVYAITDGAAFEIDPANGNMQVVTLGANRTPAATNFAAGQCVLLGIDDGTAYSVDWTTVAPVWVTHGGGGAAPTLAATGYTWVKLYKIGAVIYGESAQP